MEQKPEQSENDRLNAVVTQYLFDTKNWKPEEFRIEHKGTTSDKRLVICWGVFLEDETKPAPGAGKSVILHIDPSQGRVVEERGFQ